MFNNILVATDGSKHAYKAVDTAALLAANQGAELTILHVLMHGNVPAGFQRMLDMENVSGLKKPLDIHGPMGYPGNLATTLREVNYPDNETRYFDFLGDAIISESSKRAKELGVEKKMQGHIVKGDPADSILQMEQENSVDLIVIGSRGLGSIKGILLGSVTSKVLQLSKCPCLSVK